MIDSLTEKGSHSKKERKNKFNDKKNSGQITMIRQGSEKKNKTKQKIHFDKKKRWYSIKAFFPDLLLLLFNPYHHHHHHHWLLFTPSSLPPFASFIAIRYDYYYYDYLCLLYENKLGYTFSCFFFFWSIFRYIPDASMMMMTKHQPQLNHDLILIRARLATHLYSLSIIWPQFILCIFELKSKFYF